MTARTAVGSGRHAETGVLRQHSAGGGWPVGVTARPSAVRAFAGLITLLTITGVFMLCGLMFRGTCHTDSSDNDHVAARRNGDESWLHRTAQRKSDFP
jgi:hypothetical protein